MALQGGQRLSQQLLRPAAQVAERHLSTTRLCDLLGRPEVDAKAIEEGLRIINATEMGLHEYGGRTSFHGKVETVRLHEHNPALKRAIMSRPEDPAVGGVLVVSGGGSKLCAVMGDGLAEKAVEFGWSGIILSACVRDAEKLRELPLGLRAIGTHPLPSGKKEDEGEVGIPIQIGGATVRRGDHISADMDGIVVTQSPMACQES